MVLEGPGGWLGAGPTVSAPWRKAAKSYGPEVAREHGTYQLVKQEMDFSGAPKQVRFPANTEVAASSFDYHKLTN